MPQTATPSVQKPMQDLLHPFLAAFAIVMFLFFIDEGYYDFRWMKEWGNWFVFGLYLVLVFPIMWLIARFTFPRATGWAKTISVLAIGFALALTVTLLFWS